MRIFRCEIFYIVQNVCSILQFSKTMAKTTKLTCSNQAISYDNLIFVEHLIYNCF